MKVTDLLATGLTLQSIFLFGISLNYEGILKYFGLIGSTIVFIVELIYLYQFWRRR